MRISELAWLSVKRAVGDMGQSISYKEFCAQTKRQDTYLSNSIDRVFSNWTRRPKKALMSEKTLSIEFER